MELAVYNIKGEDTGRKVTLSDEVFGIEPNEHAIYLDVKQYLANQRQGTHKSKERSEVSGSTRKLHKKVKQLARKSALSLKARDGEIVVVENFTIEVPKTKDFINIVKNLKVEGQKVLVVLPSQDKNVYLSSRNVPGAEVTTATDINTYALLNNKALLLAEGSLDVINKL